MYLSVSYLPFFLLCLNLKVELLSATNFYQNLSPRSGNIKYVSDGKFVSLKTAHFELSRIINGH